ncbi:MAG: TIGR00730 family Rossman fold protein [Clostridia bacterium]|nr:TIGR00730 family Rossman fold protein [Clostridia bacterium]
MSNICLFGASCNNIDSIYSETAFEMGALLAENGFGLVFGGGAVGLMGAAAQGAAAQDGEIYGIIPEKLNRPGISFDSCTKLIEVADMGERKQRMVEMSSGYVVVAGGIGTLDEFFEVLSLKQLGYIDDPIIIINTNGFYDNLLAHLHGCVKEGFTDRRYLKLFLVTDSATEALKMLLEYVPPDVPDKITEALHSINE